MLLSGRGEGSVSHLTALTAVFIHRDQGLGGHLQNKCLCSALCPCELEEPEGLVKMGTWQPAPVRIYLGIVLSLVFPEMK